MKRIPFEALLIVAVGLFVLWRYTLPRNVEDEAIHVECQTTKGVLNFIIRRDWAPLGADRFLNLVDDGYLTDIALFRCMKDFVCQFGAKPLGKVYPPLADDPPGRPFQRGYLSFAGAGVGSRSSHLFIALGAGVGAGARAGAGAGAGGALGTQPWETPIGYVTDETISSTVSAFNTSYGESAPAGRGPDPLKIQAADGAEYLRRNFPDLDFIQSCVRTEE